MSLSELETTLHSESLILCNESFNADYANVRGGTILFVLLTSLYTLYALVVFPVSMNTRLLPVSTIFHCIIMMTIAIILTSAGTPIINP